MCGDRGADVEAAIDISERARRLEGAAVAVGEVALQGGEVADGGIGAGGGLRAERSRKDEAAGAKVAVPGPVDVGVGDEVSAERDVDERVGEFFVGGGAISEQARDMDRPDRHLARDPRVDDVDHAADRRGAIEQGGGAVEHFDAVGGERVDGDGMVAAGARDVEAADAVDEDQDAVARQAAQHRPRDVGPRARGRHAGLAGEGLADGGMDLRGKVGAAEDGDVAENVVLTAPGGADDDLLARRRIDGRGDSCRVGGRGGGGDVGEGNAEEQSEQDGDFRADGRFARLLNGILYHRKPVRR